MKCLVLGGGGFLGSHLSRALLAQGHDVRVFDRSRPCATQTAGLDWVQGDFTAARDVETAVQGCEVVYHLISSTIPKDSNQDPVYDLESNVVATIRMLEFALRAGARKLVFVSSGGTVYGIPGSLPIPEGHSNFPLCSYGIGKLMIEKYLHLFWSLHGLDYCVLRLANPFGECQAVKGAQGAIAVFLYRALNDQTIEIWGDGTVIRDYLYVGDAIKALLLAKDCKADCRVFNIGSGEGRSLNQVLDAIEKVIGRAVRRTYLPARNFDVPSNVLDIRQARQVLQWLPVTSFQEGLKRTTIWMQTSQLERA